MIQAIINVLNDDTTLASLAPGGIHNDVEISRQSTPTAFDANKELQTCILVVPETTIPIGPNIKSAQESIGLWIYSRDYTQLEPVRKRVFELLDRTNPQPVNGGSCYDLRHAADVQSIENPRMGIPNIMSRYIATVQRDY